MVGVLERRDALTALDGLDANAGLYMLFAPKGEGKSTLVAQWAAKRPHVILVDVGETEDLTDAARAVAAETGYDMQYSEKERAAVAAGFTLPDLSGLQGEGLCYGQPRAPLANKHVATLALVTSDPLMETDVVWRKASGRDNLRFRRIPGYPE